jgi:cytoskeletal protein CcmA (bactofilin family)
MWKKDEPTAQPQPQTAPPAPAAAPPVAVAPAAPTPAAPRERATIGQSITVVGDISGDEDLTVLGTVEGRIDLSQNSVTVGRTGKVKADVFAKNVSVEGDVHGNVYAGEAIVLRKSGGVHGNLTSPRVTLEDGCKFKGSIDMDPQSADRARAAAGASRENKPMPVAASRPQ